MIKGIAISLLFLSGVYAVNGQRTSTFENWFSAAGQVKTGDATFTLEEGWRIREMYMSRQNYTDLSLTYKLNKAFNVSAGYRLALKNSMFNVSEVNNRFYFDAMGTYDMGDLDLSMRIRYQYTSLGQEDDIQLPSETYFRNRFRARYKINGDVYASISYEMFLNSSPVQTILAENRFAGEIQYKFNKHNSLSFGYLVRSYVQVENLMNVHVLSLDYSYKF